MPKNYTSSEKTEWSYLVDVERLGDEPEIHTFEADDRQRTDIARRLAIASIEFAKASITLQRASGGIIHAMGTIEADVTQACVVSQAPVAGHIEDEFEGWFGDKGSAVSFAKARTERELKKGNMEAEIMEESADPEPIVGGKIDIGELATQYLSLALDSYPRAEGTGNEYLIEPPDNKEGAAVRKSPFEALKDWKEKR